MPAIPKKQASQTIFLATWDHKHGQDISAHTTEPGAFQQCVEWMRETLDEWVPFYAQDDDHCTGGMTDEELFESWGDVTGGNEFMTVQPIDLHKA